MQKDEVVIFKTDGGSMRPLLRSGDYTIIDRIGNEPLLEPGDSVLYKLGGKHFIHRIIGRKDDYYIVRDDTFMIGEHRVYPNQIIGTVMGVKDKFFRDLLVKVFSRGKIGWFYNRIMTSVFRIGRRLKY